MVLFTQLKVENFKRFKGEHILPLHGKGPITVIAAENGVGKTTLLHTLAGLAPCASGSVAIDDVDISGLSGRARAQQIGILFQHSDDLSSLTGHDLLMNARHPWIGRWQGVERKDEQIIERVVRDHAIAHLIDQQFGVLSGGERRRIHPPGFTLSQLDYGG